jgi:hypothetical protein
VYLAEMAILESARLRQACLARVSSTQPCAAGACVPELHRPFSLLERFGRSIDRTA